MAHVVIACRSSGYYSQWASLTFLLDGLSMCPLSDWFLSHPRLGQLRAFQQTGVLHEISCTMAVGRPPVADLDTIASGEVSIWRVVSMTVQVLAA